MNVSIGFSSSKDTSKGVAEISEQINRTSVPATKDSLILAFCNSGMDHNLFFKGLRRKFGDIPVIGGEVIGVITNEHYEYIRPAGGAMLIQGMNCGFRFSSIGGLSGNEAESGEKLFRAIGPDKGDKAAVAFFECASLEPPGESSLSLNNGTLFCDGIYRALPESVPLVGAGLVGDLSYGKSHQFCGERTGENSALGLMFSGPVKAFTRVFHGCMPLDGIYHTITKVKDGIIEELDGVPVVQVIDDFHEDREWRSEHPLKLLSLGTKTGEKYGDFTETDFMNRLILGISPDGKGIVPMEPSFREGDEILFMLRDTNRMVKTAGQGAQALVDTIRKEKKKPYFALYIDCAGRAARFCNSLNEEVREVQKIMNHNNIPLLGVYAGLEMAPYENRSTSLQWTGVLFILTEE